MDDGILSLTEIAQLGLVNSFATAVVVEANLFDSWRQDAIDALETYKSVGRWFSPLAFLVHGWLTCHLCCGLWSGLALQYTLRFWVWQQTSLSVAVANACILAIFAEGFNALINAAYDVSSRRGEK